MPEQSRDEKLLAYNKDALVAAATIERRALENYLAELVKGFGTEQDRLHAEHSLGERMLLLDVEIEDEFPETFLKLKYRNTRQDEEGWRTALIWKDPTFFDNEFKPRMEPADMAVDILMLFRGG